MSENWWGWGRESDNTLQTLQIGSEGSEHLSVCSLDFLGARDETRAALLISCPLNPGPKHVFTHVPVHLHTQKPGSDTH